MKNTLVKFLMLLPAILPAATYQTVNFGTIPGLLKDGEGIDLDGTFTAQLGTFVGFTPSSSNTDLWSGSWKLFAATTVNLSVDGPNIQIGANILYDEGLDSGHMDGYSSYAGADAYDFSNQQAWVWVKNGPDIQQTGTEWFLASLGSWMFPDVTGLGGCCPTGTPLNWSLSQLNASSVVPVWGSQGSREGGGTASVNSSTYNLQTHAIPEPSTWVLVGILFSSVSVVFAGRLRGTGV